MFTERIEQNETGTLQWMQWIYMCSVQLWMPIVTVLCKNSMPQPQNENEKRQCVSQRGKKRVPTNINIFAFLLFTCDTNTQVLLCLMWTLYLKQSMDWWCENVLEHFPIHDMDAWRVTNNFQGLQRPTSWRIFCSCCSTGSDLYTAPADTPRVWCKQ